MVENISRTGASRNNTAASTLESLRVAYNPSKKTFGPMQTSVTRNIDHMTKVGKQVSGVKVPVDYSSPAFLKNVTTEEKFSAKLLKTDTQGVNVRYPLNLLSSVQKAQKSAK